MEMAEMSTTLSLGERILLATRLAVEEHLLQSVNEDMQSDRRVTTGGAGLDRVTDDSLPFARGRALYAPSARFAEGEAA
jgi:hypothetical protein